jgi:hypothetical protein
MKITHRMVIDQSADGRYRFRPQERILLVFWRSGTASPWFDDYDRLLDEMQRVRWRLIERRSGARVSRQVRRARARKWGQRRLA